MVAPEKSKPLVGAVLEGKFRITREIGRGGMAAVYEAENIDIGKRVAVKILAPELITSRIVRERFIREARASAAIHSPYICDVYDVGMFDERPFLVMELLLGESLYDMMTRVRRIDVRTTLMVAMHVCRGLEKAHESNVVHRDLKPENIFLTNDEDGKLRAKILDFGLAKFYEPANEGGESVRLTREGALFGTPAYMSPEQGKGQGGVDLRADLWALGCIVYECLTGQTVWNVDQGVAMILAQIASAPIPRPSRLVPELPQSFDDWFMRSLQRDPDKRFQTAREFSESLASALDPNRARTTNPDHEVDSHAVDQLIGSPMPQGPRSQSAPGSMSGAQLAHSVSRDGPALPPSLAPPPIKSSARAVGLLLGAAAVAIGGYAAWLYVVNPPGQLATTTRAASTADAAAPYDAGSGVGRPLESEPYAIQIGQAQDLLRKGERKRALIAFQDAFKKGGTSVARALFSHAGVAVAQEAAKCRVNGLGRPRPFEFTLPISRPTIAATERGTVFVWVDNQQDQKRRQAFSVLLDDALRRVSTTQLVTPEASAVRDPEIELDGNRIAFIYWDGAGKEPGVYVRHLELDGRIASRARRISDAKISEFAPALARTPTGTYWATWVQEVEKGVSDLMGRRLSADLEPLSEPVRLTALAPQKELVAVTEPDIAIAHDHLYASFVLTRGQLERQVTVMRVRLDDPILGTGADKPAPDPKEKNKTKNRGRGPEKRTNQFAGTVQLVGSERAKNAQPRLGCVADGCFVVWDDEEAGAFAAFFDREKGQALWHREFAAKGARPAIAATDPSGAVTVWYQGGRVQMAGISRDGIDRPSVLSRVTGFQPYPGIAPGTKPHEWYISWRDYEAGHLEGFVLRVECQ